LRAGGRHNICGKMKANDGSRVRPGQALQLCSFAASLQSLGGLKRVDCVIVNASVPGKVKLAIRKSFAVPGIPLSEVNHPTAKA
jgi:hypothetical protein